MKSLFTAAALVFALTFSVTTPAAEETAMPVLFQSVQNGPTYPVLALKDGAYYPVKVYEGGQPFFTDESNQDHFVSNEASNENYQVYYMNGQTSAPVAVPQGQTDEAKVSLLQGNNDAHVNLVRWGARGYYGYGYYSYRNYSYYPRYYYGGYTGARYYGGAYYGGYYGGYSNYGYYGGYYNSGYYGWRSCYSNPYTYSGRCYVLNNWCW